MPEAVLIALSLLIAVILHEIAHGYVAKLNGDPTADRLGRLSINPLRHIDPVGTVLLPALMVMMGATPFGWAKPVPVNFANLRHPKTDMVKVAAAGPVTNVLLAVASALLFRFAGGWQAEPGGLAHFAIISLQVNTILAVLNLVPILPLDGGRMVAGLLPRAQAISYARLERYGLPLVMLLLMSGALDQVIGPVQRLLVDALLLGA
jgi:Zn-dependent protease